MLGRMHAESFEKDPKHLSFVLARYQFVAQMLFGKARVLEVGCGDGTGARIVKPNVGHWEGIDRVEYPGARGWDIVEDGAYPGGWDAVYCLDVLEHIDPVQENIFFENILNSMNLRGCLIIGSPSLESQPYASELSKLHHVNCKTQEGLRKTMERYFENVFIFGMNDSTLHTGYGPMCHYRLAIGAGRK